MPSPEKLTTGDVLSLQRVVGNAAVTSLLTIQRAPVTWYRGEAPGVGRAKPGGHIHDLGDGLYLSDSPAAAQGYGDLRAGKPGQGTVVGRAFDQRLLGKTLDLTADPHWAEFLNRRIPVIDITWREYATKGTEQYWAVLKGFLSENNIDFAQYDSVVGEDFIRNPGAKQLCIRNPRIAEKIDDMLERVPEPTVKASATEGGGSSGKVSSPVEVSGRPPSGSVSGEIESAKVRPAVRGPTGGGAMMGEVAAGIEFAVGMYVIPIALYLLDRWVAAGKQEEIEKAWKANAPEVQAQLRRLGVGEHPSGEFATILQRTKGAKLIYANISFQLDYPSMRYHSYGRMTPEEAGQASVPGGARQNLREPDLEYVRIKLTGIKLSTTSINRDEGHEHFVTSIPLYDPRAMATELVTKAPEVV